MALQIRGRPGFSAVSGQEEGMEGMSMSTILIVHNHNLRSYLVGVRVNALGSVYHAPSHLLLLPSQVTISWQCTRSPLAGRVLRATGGERRGVGSACLWDGKLSAQLFQKY